MGEQGTHLIRTLHEVALFPPHAPRQATGLFRTNHRRMIVHEDQPCRNCGVRHSDLADPQRRAAPGANPFGASQMELHHWVYEDALAGAIDLDYFNTHTRPGMAAHTGDAQTYRDPFTQEQIEAWIHGHAHNLLPLCDMCHRHQLIGIHAVTYPVWRAIPAVKKGWNLTGFVAYSPAEAQQLTALPQTTGTAQPPAPAPPTT